MRLQLLHFHAVFKTWPTFQELTSIVSFRRRRWSQSNFSENRNIQCDQSEDILSKTRGLRINIFLASRRWRWCPHLLKVPIMVISPKEVVQYIYQGNNHLLKEHPQNTLTALVPGAGYDTVNFSLSPSLAQDNWNTGGTIIFFRSSSKCKPQKSCLCKWL